MNEVEKAKVLAAAVNYTKREMEKLRQEFATITSLKESQLEYPTMMEGPQGPQGPSGPQGPRGEPGDAIIVETRGPQGHQGIQGESGISVKEAKIINEELILYYDNGETENVGKVIGPRGGQGLKGDVGDQGEVGPIGEQGPIGPEGPTGPRGFLGEQGEPGPTGPMGPMGVTGPKGDKGDQGVKGDTGERGIQGPIGPTGAAGEKGERGEQGPVGLTGPQGRDGTQVDTSKIQKDLEVNLEEFKNRISGQVTRLATAGGGASSGSGIGPRPKTTLHVRDIIPEANVTYSLGTDALRFKDLFLSGNTLSLGTATITTSDDGGIKIPNVEANTMLVLNPDNYHLFTTKVITKTSSHPYHGTGSNYGYTLNGQESPTLILVPNMTYRFDQSDSSNSTHPLRFYRDAAKSTSYSTGVTTSGTAGNAGAYVEIAVTIDTPSLFYQCSSHAYMGSAASVTSGVIQQDVTDAVNDLIDAAPSQLNTLNELAAALNDDASFSTTVVNLINDRMQVANVATLTSTSAIQTKAALANTNSFIATKLDTSSYTTADVQSKAALANTNTFIATKLNSSSYTTADVQSKAALANTNAFIATKLNSSSYTTGDVQTKAALANTNSAIASLDSNKVSAGATNITFSGESVTIQGNLVVQGTTTQTTSASANVVNQFMILNSGLGAGVSPSQNAGIRVNRGSSANVELRFNESNDKFEFTNNGSAFNNIPTPADIALANTNAAITTVNNNIEETSLALAIALG